MTGSSDVFEADMEIGDFLLRTKVSLIGVLDQIHMEGVNVWKGKLEHSKIMEGQIPTEAAKLREVLFQFWVLFPHLERLHSLIKTKLQELREEQRLVDFGKPLDERILAKIEIWFGNLTESLEMLEKYLLKISSISKSLDAPDIYEDCQKLIDKIQNLRSQLILSSLVVESQPTQVITPTKSFGPVRLRVLPLRSGMEVSIEGISAILINEIEAGELVQKKKTDAEYIPESSGTLESSEVTPSLNGTLTFETFTLEECDRTKMNKTRPLATEQHYLIYFQVTVNVRGTLYHLWTTTLPFVITAIQESAAWATILWDATTPSLKRTELNPRLLSADPPDVPWTNLIELIDLKFLSVGKRLSKEDKIYLKKKLFRSKDSEIGEMVSHQQFFKDAIVAVNIVLLGATPFSSDVFIGENGGKYTDFTFWMWIWSILELLSKTRANCHCNTLRDLWRDGKIAGFMSDNDIIEKLSKASEDHPLTKPFLLRFAERKPDSIGMYFLENGQSSTKKLIRMAYNKKDLERMPLQERILKCKGVTHLYPNIPKEEAFGHEACHQCRSVKVVNSFAIISIQLNEINLIQHNIVQQL